MPRITGEQSVNIGSEYVYDQTNIRLRELSLSYRLPSSLLDNVGISSASLSIIGRKFILFYTKKVDNFDPESSYATGNFSQGVLFLRPSDNQKPWI